MRTGVKLIVKCGNHRRAITVLELLVVTSVFLLILAMLIPGLGTARERARRLMCKNNLHQWGQALHFYRNDYNDYIPTEAGLNSPYAWFNALPPYFDLPPYKDFEGANEQIKDLPNIHVWICPAKNVTSRSKSDTGKNQFHYAMNNVLDGVGQVRPSRDTPGFADQGSDPLPAWRFAHEPKTVMLFDIANNSSFGGPRQVATMYQRGYRGAKNVRFHGDFANLLLLTGAVTDCTTDDLVTDRDFQHGDIIWNHPNLYWGYRPQ